MHNHQKNLIQLLFKGKLINSPRHSTSRFSCHSLHVPPPPPLPPLPPLLPPLPHNEFRSKEKKHVWNDSLCIIIFVLIRLSSWRIQLFARGVILVHDSLVAKRAFHCCWSFSYIRNFGWHVIALICWKWAFGPEMTHCLSRRVLLSLNVSQGRPRLISLRGSFILRSKGFTLLNRLNLDLSSLWENVHTS